MSEIIEGLEAFERRLKELELTVQRDMLRKATRVGAEVIRAEAAIRAPRRTGELASEEMLAVSESNATEVIVRIGPSKDAFYGLFQELGTAHHPAQPFLLPAFEDKKAEALQVAGEHLKNAIEKVPA